MIVRTTQWLDKSDSVITDENNFLWKKLSGTLGRERLRTG